MPKFRVNNEINIVATPPRVCTFREWDVSKANTDIVFTYERDITMYAMIAYWLK